MPIAEGVIAVIYEALKIIGGELGSKLERDLRDILKQHTEGEGELAAAMAKKYPNYNDYDVQKAEGKIKDAEHRLIMFKDAFVATIKEVKK